MKEAKKHVLAVVVTLKGSNFSYEIERTIVTEKKYESDVIKAMYASVKNAESNEFTFNEDSFDTLGINKIVGNEKQRIHFCSFDKNEIGSLEINYLREYEGDLEEVYYNNPRSYKMQLFEKQNWFKRLFKKLQATT